MPLTEAQQAYIQGLRDIADWCEAHPDYAPGNSGGGLYDTDGYCLGINTWTHDKSVSEGIGFAITLDTLAELAPPPLAGMPEKPAGAGDPLASPAASPNPGKPAGHP